VVVRKYLCYTSMLLTIMACSKPGPKNITKAFVKGPYLQNVTGSSAVIMWETAAEEAGKVHYGEDKLTDIINEQKPAAVHEIKITGLSPGIKYWFQVTAAGAKSKKLSFTTDPGKDVPVKFLVYGDTRSNPHLHRKVADVMSKIPADLVLHSGDLITNGKDSVGWNREFFSPARNLLARFPFYPAIGNHARNAHYYYDYFSLPGNEQWYTFTRGNARFIMLNTCTDCNKGSQQYAWAEQTLAAATEKWLFAVFHHPPYSGGGVGRLKKQVRSDLAPLLIKYGVDMVFNGHDHYYERTHPIKLKGKNQPATVFVVTGGGGAPLSSTSGKIWTAKAFTGLHFCHITLDRDIITYQVLDTNNAVLDELSWKKGDKKLLARALVNEHIEKAEKIIPEINIEPLIADPGKNQQTVNIKLRNKYRRSITVDLKIPETGPYTIRSELKTHTIKPMRSIELKLPVGYTLKQLFPLPKIDINIRTGKYSNRVSRQIPVKQQVVALKAAAVPKIDGILGEELWQNLNQDCFNGRKGLSTPADQTSFAVYYDADNLYIGVRCSESSLAKLRADCVKPDDPVYTDDCIEIFIDPRFVRKDYYQLVANSRGTRYDSHRKKSDWNGNWQIAAGKEKGAWTLELLVPRKDLKEEKGTLSGRQWGFNMTRMDNTNGSILSQWNPTLGGNHAQGRFGIMLFE